MRRHKTAYTGTANVEVANDLTTSVANEFSAGSNRFWCGVDSGLVWDTTITSTPPATDVANVGSQDNDAIDWFYTRVGGR